MIALKQYDFPNATIKVYADRTCREFPRWCPMISVTRTRAYVAEALAQFRVYKRTEGARHD